jgi:GNAT superfamily N-acetyltransferase
MTVITQDYLPTKDLDTRLAELGYAAVRGWPDQRPVTGPMVRSLLRPAGMTATTLALHRDDDGQLLGAAALRWPATTTAAGRFWGPVVHPHARGIGLGRRLVAALEEVLATHPGVRFTTTEIPESRAAGWALFQSLGWRCEPVSSLLARALPARISVPTSVPVRPARHGEYLDAALSELVFSFRPQLCPSIARDTFARWSGDARYTPSGLLLAETPDGLAGAVLVYPNRHTTADEPAEALIADLLTCHKLVPEHATAVRATLVAAALQMADESGATIARAVADSQELEDTLRSAGFEPVDQIRHYTGPN